MGAEKLSEIYIRPTLYFNLMLSHYWGVRIGLKLISRSYYVHFHHNHQILLTEMTRRQICIKFSCAHSRPIEPRPIM